MKTYKNFQSFSDFCKTDEINEFLKSYMNHVEIEAIKKGIENNSLVLSVYYDNKRIDYIVYCDFSMEIYLYKDKNKSAYSYPTIKVGIQSLVDWYALFFKNNFITFI